MTDAGRVAQRARSSVRSSTTSPTRPEEPYMLFALSGAPRRRSSASASRATPRSSPPPSRARAWCGRPTSPRTPATASNPPHRGMPAGHPPVRSYLAAPVRSRSGEVIGGLFFGHPDAGVFTARAERLIGGRGGPGGDRHRQRPPLPGRPARDRRAPPRRAHQRLLMNELNHRVKNTLATVQSMGPDPAHRPQRGGGARGRSSRG